MFVLSLQPLHANETLEVCIALLHPLPGPHLICAPQVEVDLDLNAHANARTLHADRKARSVKQAKTLAANTRALKVAEKKAQAQLSQVCPCQNASCLF